MHLITRSFPSLSVLCVVLLAHAIVNAQSVTITPRKETYKRTAPDVPDFKRRFEVRYPVFSGNLTRAALANLKTNTDYWHVFEITLEENLKDDDWLTSLDYQVIYNKNNLLDIRLTMEGLGAYPDTSYEYLVFDLRTGNKVQFEDVFTQLAKLRDVIRGKMKRQELALGREMRRELAMHRSVKEEVEYYPPPAKLELENLEGFSISDRGVTFLYDYGYAHVSQALQPPGRFFFSWAQLKPFIRRDGLLARFIA